MKLYIYIYIYICVQSVSKSNKVDSAFIKKDVKLVEILIFILFGKFVSNTFIPVSFAFAEAPLKRHFGYGGKLHPSIPNNIFTNSIIPLAQSIGFGITCTHPLRNRGNFIYLWWWGSSPGYQGHVEKLFIAITGSL